MTNKKKTSQKVAKIAGEVLANPNASAIQKSLAGSALSQKNKSKQTGDSMEDIASKVLKSKKYNDTTKKLAASVLAQSNKKR